LKAYHSHWWHSGHLAVWPRHRRRLWLVEVEFRVEVHHLIENRGNDHRETRERLILALKMLFELETDDKLRSIEREISSTS
jgi:hypothetical protein